MNRLHTRITYCRPYGMNPVLSACVEKGRAESCDCCSFSQRNSMPFNHLYREIVLVSMYIIQRIDETMSEITQCGNCTMRHDDNTNESYSLEISHISICSLVDTYVQLKICLRSEHLRYQSRRRCQG